MTSNHYLLTYKEGTGSFTNGDEGYQRAVQQTRNGQRYEENWSIAANWARIRKGDIVFIRRSVSKRAAGGVIARGKVTCEPYLGPDEWRDHLGQRTALPPKTRPHRIRFELDSILGADETPCPLPISPQSSGTRIKQEIALELETKWRTVFERGSLS